VIDPFEPSPGRLLLLLAWLASDHNRSKQPLRSLILVSPLLGLHNYRRGGPKRSTKEEPAPITYTQEGPRACGEADGPLFPPIHSALMTSPSSSAEQPGRGGLGEARAPTPAAPDDDAGTCATVAAGYVTLK